jgi:hypothetical protein
VLDAKKKKPFKRFFFVRAFNTRLKPGVNEKFSTMQQKTFELAMLVLLVATLIFGK